MGREDRKCFICANPAAVTPGFKNLREGGAFDFLCDLLKFSHFFKNRWHDTVKNADFCRSCELNISKAMSACEQIKLLQISVNAVRTNIRKHITSAYNIKKKSNFSSRQSATVLARMLAQCWSPCQVVLTRIEDDRRSRMWLKKLPGPVSSDTESESGSDSSVSGNDCEVIAEDFRDDRKRNVEDVILLDTPSSPVKEPPSKKRKKEIQNMEVGDHYDDKSIKVSVVRPNLRTTPDRIKSHSSKTIDDEKTALKEVSSTDNAKEADDDEDKPTAMLPFVPLDEIEMTDPKSTPCVATIPSPADPPEQETLSPRRPSIFELDPD